MISSSHLMDRKILNITTSKSSKLTLSVLQWNVLARCYSNTTSLPSVEPELLDFDKRKEMIAQEINSFDADILCLEEIDNRDITFYESLFSEKDYTIHFAKKPSAEDGNLIVLRKKFEVVEKEEIAHFDTRNMRRDNMASQIVICKYVKDDVELYFIIATTHLKSMQKFEPVRTRQAAQFMEAILKKRKKYKELLEKKKDNLAIIVCGDFNDIPESKPVNIFLKNEEVSLNSAFNGEPYTLFQTYGSATNEPLIEVFDYIFYSNQLTLLKKIGPPNKDILRKDGLVSKIFPSDHLSLYCELSFE